MVIMIGHMTKEVTKMKARFEERATMSSGSVTFSVTSDAVREFILGNMAITISRRDGHAEKLSTIEKIIANNDFFDVVVCNDNISADDAEMFLLGIVSLYGSTIALNGAKTGGYLKIAPVNTSAAELRKASGKTRTLFRTFSVNSFGGISADKESMKGGLQIICKDAHVSADDIIQVSFANIAEVLNDRLAAEARIRRAFRNGIVVKNGKPYYVSDDTNVAYSLYGKSAIRINGMKIFKPGFYTNSGRMEGKMYFIESSKAAEWQTAAAGCTMAKIQKISVAKFMKSMDGTEPFALTAKAAKTAGLGIGAKEDLRECGLVDEPHIVVVDKNKYAISDGGMSANTKCGLESGIYQCRLVDTSSKGDLDVNDVLFNTLVYLINQSTGVDVTEDTTLIPWVRHYGDTTQPVSVIMDTDSWKHDPFREIFAAGGHHWLCKRFPETPNNATLSESALLKLQRVLGLNISNQVAALYKAEARQALWDAAHCDPNSMFPLTMLAGLDRSCTIASINYAHSCMIEENGSFKPTKAMLGYVLPIATHHAFDKKEGMIMADYGISEQDSEFIAFAHPDTLRKIGRKVMAIRYPETGERNKPTIHVVADSRCSKGQLYFAANARTEALKLVLTGADFDGDKVSAFTIEDADGKSTILGKMIEKSATTWECDSVKNVFDDAPCVSVQSKIDVARRYALDTTGTEFLGDMFAAVSASSVGSIVTYNNVVKLATEKYQLSNNDGAVPYAWKWQWEEDSVAEKSLRTQDIRDWMAYVGDNGSNVVINPGNAAKWRRDVGIIGNWLAEVATAVATTGHGVPKDIWWFFHQFSAALTTRAAEAELALKRGENEGMSDEDIRKNGLVRSKAQLRADLQIGEEFNIRNAVNAAIEDAFTEIKSMLGLDQRENLLSENEKNTLAKTGFFNFIGVARGRNWAWDYLNGSIQNNASEGTVTGKNGEVSVSDYVEILHKAGYKSRVLPEVALRKAGYADDIISAACRLGDRDNKAVMSLSVLDDGTDRLNALVAALDAAASSSDDDLNDDNTIETISVRGQNDKKRVTVVLVNKKAVALDKEYTNKLVGVTTGKWTPCAVFALTAKGNSKYHNYVVLLDRAEDKSEAAAQ